MFNIAINKFVSAESLSESERVSRSVAVSITLLTCVFGALYSAVYIFWFNIPILASVVITYIIWSLLNLTIFYYFRWYGFFRISQLILISIFPISTQLFIGGFVASSGVGMSAILAPIGALLFYNIKVARYIFVFVITLLLVSGILEYNYLIDSPNFDRETIIVFFLVVICSTSTVIYLTIEYVISQNKKITNTALDEAKTLKMRIDALEDENQQLKKFQEFHLKNN
jgi:hypothetical protein